MAAARRVGPGQLHGAARGEGVQVRRPSQRLWRARIRLTIAVIAGLVFCPLQLSVAHAAPRNVGVQFVWLRGHDADRPTLDAFADCLFLHSNFEAFWQSELTLSYRGSIVVEPPSAPIDEHSAAAFLESRGVVPGAADESVFIVLAPAASLNTQACGANTTATLAGRRTAVAVVRTDPPCWPGLGAVRSETQYAQHEIAEAIDQLMGHGGYAGDGACEGDNACPHSCANFTGLMCPGAPTGSYTGCDSHRVDGWIVQTLTHEGRDVAPTQCFSCDFTLRYCENGTRDSACAPVSPPPPSAPPPSSASCAAESLSGPSGTAILSALVLFAARRRRGG